MKKLMALLKNVRRILKWHLVDSTAMVTLGNPIFTVIEKLAGMSNAVSIKARIVGSLLGYLGLVSVITRGRDFSKKVFKITDKTPETRQFLHDAIYLAIFHLLWMPAFYLICGARDMKEIALGTLGGLVYGLFSGAPIGYIIGVFRDLFGLQKCERRIYPNFVSSKASFTKIVIAIALFGFSILVMTVIYLLAAA